MDFIQEHGNDDLEQDSGVLTPLGGTTVPASAGREGPPGLRPDHERCIIHFDIDCFYAQVEEVLNPALRGKPVGIKQKYLLVTCNYTARRLGVRKMRSVNEAKRRCPSLIVMDGEDLTRYREASEAIFSYVASVCGPAVQRLGMDEIFADVTEHIHGRCGGTGGGINENASPTTKAVTGHLYSPGSGGKLLEAQTGVEISLEADSSNGDGHGGDSTGIVDIADAGRGDDEGRAVREDGAMRNVSEAHGPGSVGGVCTCRCGCFQRLAAASAFAEEVRRGMLEKVGYTCSGGIGSSKATAKLAGELHKPNQQTTILPEHAMSMILQLPLRKLPGCGYSTCTKIKAELGITETRQLRASPWPLLARAIGLKLARVLYLLCRGEDYSPVVPSVRPKTMSDEDSFKRGSLTSREQVERNIRRLAAPLLLRAGERARLHREAPEILRFGFRRASTGYGSRISRQCAVSSGVAAAWGTVSTTAAAAAAADAGGLSKRWIRAGPALARGEVSQPMSPPPISDQHSEGFGAAKESLTPASLLTAREHEASDVMRQGEEGMSPGKYPGESHKSDHVTPDSPCGTTAVGCGYAKERETIDEQAWALDSPRSPMSPAAADLQVGPASVKPSSPKSSLVTTKSSVESLRTRQRETKEDAAAEEALSEVVRLSMAMFDKMSPPGEKVNLTILTVGFASFRTLRGGTQSGMARFLGASQSPSPRKHEQKGDAIDSDEAKSGGSGSRSSGIRPPFENYDERISSGRPSPSPFKYDKSSASPSSTPSGKRRHESSAASIRLEPHSPSEGLTANATDALSVEGRLLSIEGSSATSPAEPTSMVVAAGAEAAEARGALSGTAAVAGNKRPRLMENPYLPRKGQQQQQQQQQQQRQQEQQQHKEQERLGKTMQERRGEKQTGAESQIIEVFEKFRDADDWEEAEALVVGEAGRTVLGRGRLDWCAPCSAHVLRTDMEEHASSNFHQARSKSCSGADAFRPEEKSRV